MPRAEDVFDALKYRVVVDAAGTRRYYNDAGQLHRKNGPAVEWSDGGREWYQNGQPHRIGGPAIALAHGETRWCLYGVEYSKYSYEQQLATLGL